MQFRTSLAAVAAFICSFGSIALLFLLTLQTTFLDSNTVKAWIRESGAYNSAAALVPASGNSTLFATQAVQNALTPAYVQSQTEQALDNVYAWVDGKTQTAGVLSAQQDDKVRQLAVALEPTVARLPTCTTPTLSQGQAGQCRPADQGNAAFAETLARQTLANSNLLNGPLTGHTTTQTSATPTATTGLFGLLPSFRQWITMSVWLLPILITLGFAYIAFASADRISTLTNVNRRIFFISTVTLLFASVIWFLGSNLKGLPGANSPDTLVVIRDVFVPVAQKVLQGVGAQLALFSGSTTTASFAAWMTFRTILRRRKDLAAAAAILTPKFPTMPQTPTL